MEKTIEMMHCQSLIDGFFSFNTLDICKFAITGIITHCVLTPLERRHLFLPRSFLLRTFLLRILLPYLLERLCAEYIRRILSYIYIFTCTHLLSFYPSDGSKSIVTTTIIPLLRSIPKWSVRIVDRISPKQLPHLLFSPIFNLTAFLISQKPTMSTVSFFPSDNLKSTPVRKEAQVDIRDVRISRDELMLAMASIGQHPSEEREKMKNFIGYEEFNALFQESEPSLDEVKEAFSVFDRNRDGLVDAGDLQRVLDNLGLRTGTNLDACDRMIAQHDRNGDGYVDRIDFSRLLEMCLLEKVD